ncbi:MAG: dTDP-4-keto-6-deoxy-D-glucose epimerase, partial [Deltaproteobacteria bacterium]|nr:dTDP-4-keto-6-deoxy-D-glucose epimerase [Deltaproteobacteria bacterium]
YPLAQHHYLFTDEYGIAWNSPDIAIDWPIMNPLLSDKDSSALPLRDTPGDHLPGYQDE